jgi:hypothetical protein
MDFTKADPTNSPWSLPQRQNKARISPLKKHFIRLFFPWNGLLWCGYCTCKGIEAVSAHNLFTSPARHDAKGLE